MSNEYWEWRRGRARLLRAHLDEARLRIERARGWERLGARDLYSEAGRPIFRRSFAFYLDELGSKARVQSLSNDQLRESVELQDSLRYLVDSDEGYGASDARLVSFSDNLVLGCPFGWSSFPREDGGLLVQIESIANYQLGLALRGRFYRGGVAVGDLYIDDSYVVGGALVEAVRIEESDAVYPRVVLSPDCVALVLAERRESGDDGGGLIAGDPLLVDADGLVFLNYLYPLMELEDESRQEASDAFQRHRAMIVERLDQHLDDPWVRAKYVWLATYHNSVTRSYPGLRDLAIVDGLSEFERKHPRQFLPLGAG